MSKSKRKNNVIPIQQVFNDNELGRVMFFDLKEKTPSVKCRVADIQLVDRYDRVTGKRLKQEIVKDINEGRK